MSTGEIIVAVLTSSAFTGLLVEIVRSVRRIIDRKKNKGFAKLENDISCIREKTAETESKVDEIQDELQRQKETDLVLLHDRIWEIFNRLHEAQSVSVEDKANLEYLYEEYKNSNGNHHAEIMFEVIESKPVKGKKGELK